MYEAIKPEDVVEAAMVVQAVISTGAAFGYATGDKAQGPVYVPPGTSMRFNMRPGDSYQVRLIPNYEDRRNDVPWRTIYVYEEETTASLPAFVREAKPLLTDSFKAPAKPVLTDDDVKRLTAETMQDGAAWTTREVFTHIFERAPNYKDTEDARLVAVVGNKLRAMCRDGLVYRAELYSHATPAHNVYFCTSMRGLVPNAHKDRADD
jgi:hypothetical protein